MLKNLLLVLLTISTIGCATFAWRATAATRESEVQRQQLLAALQAQRPHDRASTVDAAVAERARATRMTEEIEAERAKHEALVRDLRGEISLLQAGRARGPALASRPAPLAGARAVLAELLGKAETAGLAMDWIKADQYGQYASLIARQDKLSDAQREDLRTLLAERYATRMDLAALGAADALPAEQKRKLDAEYHQRLVALVGADEAELFERVETKPVSFDRIQRLEDRLRYEANPLGRDQYTAMWPILSSGVFYFNLPTDDAGVQALVQRRAEANAKVLAQAQSVLQPVQYQSLELLLRDDAATFQVQLYTTVRQRNLLEKPTVKPTPGG